MSLILAQAAAGRDVWWGFCFLPRSILKSSFTLQRQPLIPTAILSSPRFAFARSQHTASDSMVPNPALRREVISLYKGS